MPISVTCPTVRGASLAVSIVVVFGPSLCAQDLKLRRSIPGPDKTEVTALAFSPDGRVLASAGSDKVIRIWQNWKDAKAKVAGELGGHLESIKSIAISPDSKTLASGNFDASIMLWDIASGKNVATVERQSTSMLTAVAFHPNGTTLAYSMGRTIKFWDLVTRKNTLVLNGHGREVGTLAFSPDGKLLASGSWDQSVRLWDAATGKQLSTLKIKGKPYTFMAVAFSPDGTLLAGAQTFTGRPAPANAGFAGAIQLWDVATQASMGSLSGHKGGVLSIAFSPDGKTLASGGADRTVRIWDVSTGQNVKTIEQADALGVCCVAFSPDGRILASAGESGDIKLWEFVNARKRGRHHLPERPKGCFAQMVPVPFFACAYLG